jgi:hypothetical protein
MSCYLLVAVCCLLFAVCCLLLSVLLPQLKTGARTTDSGFPFSLVVLTKA